MTEQNSPGAECVLWLARFAPLDAGWIGRQRAAFSPGEAPRLAQIRRALRREQFVAGHVLLRRLLRALGVAEPLIEIRDGRPIAVGTRWRVSLAHSDRAVAALASRAPAGVDIERLRPLRDPDAMLALLGRPPPDGGDASAAALQAWVVAEARIKAGAAAAATAWVARHGDLCLAVAGTPGAPTMFVHDLAAETYNRAAQEWTAAP